MKGPDEHAGASLTHAGLEAFIADLESRFPGRTVLKVGELAKVMGVCPGQIHDLIEVGELVAINVGNTSGNKSARKCWRIPFSAVRCFVEGAGRA